MTRSVLYVGGGAIVVEVDPVTRHGTIWSDLRQEAGEFTSDENTAWSAALDVIEAVVLSHACAGVDVAALAYQMGLDSALGAIAEHI